MASATHNLVGDYAIDKGASWEIALTITHADGSRDLTGYTFAAQIRTKPLPTAEKIVDISCVVIDAALGQVLLSLTAAQTGQIQASAGFWDLEMTRSADGFVRRLLSGKVEFPAQVTV